MIGNRRVITYFVEDRAQESLIKALIERMTVDMGISIHHDLASFTGGSRSLVRLKSFIYNERRHAKAATDLLVISIDGNCQGYLEKRKEIAKIVQEGEYLKPFVCAVPDPHIERWYLCDSQAVRQALSANIHPTVPPYKCERDRYKTELIKVISQAGLTPIVGGSEHAKAIVEVYY